MQRSELKFLKLWCYLEVFTLKCENNKRHLSSNIIELHGHRLDRHLSAYILYCVDDERKNVWCEESVRELFPINRIWKKYCKVQNLVIDHLLFKKTGLRRGAYSSVIKS